MDSVQLNILLFEDPKITLKVFLATSTKLAGDLVVKQYSCKSYEEADILMKEAVRQAHESYPLWSALADVFFHGSHSDFTVNLVYVKFVADLPRDFVEKNDRVGTAAPGLSAYRLDSILYKRIDAGVISVLVHAATHVSTSIPVVVKMFKGLRGFSGSSNRMLMEAVVQAHVYHENNTKLLDIAVESDFRVCLVMEKLDRDVAHDIEQRQREHRPYSERELWMFLKQVTAGLIHAKKVSVMQRIAHRDIKPANVFIDMDGNYKVGDFGSAWKKCKEKPNTYEAGMSEVERVFVTLTGSGDGTIQYLSPEMRELLMDGNYYLPRESIKRATNDVDAFASDVYSLGITLLELVNFYVPGELITADIQNQRQIVEIHIAAMSHSATIKDIVKSMLSWTPSSRPIMEAVFIQAKAELSTSTQLQHKRDLKEMTPKELASKEAKVKAKIEKLTIDDNITALAHKYELLAEIKMAQSMRKQALKFEEQALSIRLIQFGENHLETARSYTILAIIYQSTGRLSEAEEYARKSLSILLRVHGENHSDTAASYNNLAQIYQSAGRLSEAEEYTRKSLSITIKLLGENHSDTVTSYNNLACIYQSTGRLSEAEKYTRNL